MSERSASSRVIDAIIAAGPAPLLKAAGYRKAARSFHANAQGLFKIVNFQASLWNSPDAARFTINLNITLPYYHEKWTGQPFPKNPASAARNVSQRIGFLMAGHQDHWWSVSPATDFGRVARHVAKAVSDHGLPFLDQHADLGLLIGKLEEKQAHYLLSTNPDLGLAILLTFRGEHSKAERILRQLAEENTHEGYGRTIQTIAQRLGMEITVEPGAAPDVDRHAG